MSHSGWRHLPCISVVIWSHASLNTMCVFQAWPGLAVVQAFQRWPSTVEAWLRHLDVSMWDLWCSVAVVQVSVRVLCFFLYAMPPMLRIRISLDARWTCWVMASLNKARVSFRCHSLVRTETVMNALSGCFLFPFSVPNLSCLFTLGTTLVFNPHC